MIDPAYPDYDLMRQIVQDAIDPAAGRDAAAGRRPGDRRTDAGRPSAADGGPPSRAAARRTRPTDVADACAYDPAQAEEALAAGRAADARRLSRAATCWRS